MTTAAIEIHKALLRAERAEALLDEAVELLTDLAQEGDYVDVTKVRAFLGRLDQPGIDRHAYDKTILRELRKNLRGPE